MSYFKKIITFVLILFLISCQKRKQVNIENGFLDLSNWNLETEGIISLEGKWSFYYSKLLLPEDFKQEPIPVPSGNMHVPGSWNGEEINKEKLKGEGYGTYYLKIKLPKEHPNLAIKFNYAATSLKAYSNGKLIHEQGVVGTSQKFSIPSYINQIKFIEASEELELIIQVSNFFHKKGGLWQNILIGKERDIQVSNDFVLFYDFFLFGVLCIMTIYHLGLYLLRREEKTYLFFASFCFIISVRILFTGETWITTLIKDIDWSNQIKIEYATFYISPTFFASFVYYLYKKEFNKFIWILICLVGTLFLLLVVLTPPYFFTESLLYFQIFTILCGLYCLFALVLAIIRKRVGAIAACIGWVLFFLSIVGDIYINEIYGSSVITPFGLFIFIFSQSFILSLIFSQTFKKSISLTEHLKSTNVAYSRFVPSDFIEYLKRDDITEVLLGDQIKTEMTVLFCDIRSFSTLSESMTPEDTFKFLNAYLKRVGPVIRNNNGFIDKFMGDGIMALFSGKPEDAILSAIQIQEEVRAYNIHRLKQNYSPIEVGIGVHIGNLMLGTIGEANRMDATVISDAVNLASRLEGLTKVYGSPVLISDETFNRVIDQENYKCRVLGRVQVKGKKESVGILEIIDGNNDEIAEYKLSSKPIFEKGIIFYLNKDFEAAKNVFENIYKAHPEDKAAKLFYERSIKFIQTPPSPDWDGVEIFEIK